MIISASRRTDIPAFYSRWLLRRLEEGEVLVRNPVRPGQVSRISLAPENVDALVFWTKNPAPFLPQLPVIASMGYSFYVLFTITPYGERIEPGVPGIETRVEVFRALSRLLGRERVIWRYDPVILGGGMDADWHAGAFRYLASRLSGSTCRCMFSFLRLSQNQAAYGGHFGNRSRPAGCQRACRQIRPRGCRPWHFPFHLQSCYRSFLPRDHARLLHRSRADRTDRRATAFSDPKRPGPAQGLRLCRKPGYRQLRHLSARLPLLLRRFGASRLFPRTPLPS